MSTPTANRLTYSGLGLICLWLVAEFVLLGPASVIPTASNGEVVVPALLSERFAADFGALWQNITTTGADKGVFTYYNTIDTFLFTALPGWLAHALRISSVICAGVLGAYVVSRKIFGFSRPASCFVGATYGVTIPGLLISASLGYLLVVFLTLFHVLSDKKRPVRWIILAVVLFIFADTTYFSQLIPWSAATIVFWFIFVNPRTAAGDWAIIAGSCLTLVLLRLDDFAALFANAPMSYIGLARTVPDFAETLIGAFTHPYFLSGPVAVTCSFLFLYGLYTDGRKNKRAISVGLALVIGMFLYPLGVAVQTFASEILPFLKGYRMGYAVRIPAAILPFAAGYGVDALIREGVDFRVRSGSEILKLGRCLGLVLAIGVLGFVSLKAKYANLYGWVTNGSYAHNFKSPVIKEFAEKIRDSRSPVRVETFQIIPNYLHAYGIETAGGYQALHPKRYYEYWAKMVDPWASAIGPKSRFYPQYSKRRAMTEKDMAFRDDRLWLFPDNYKPEWRLGDSYHLNFLSLANVGYFLSRERLTDTSLVPVREIPRPWSSLSTPEKTAINIKANFQGREYFYIYKNTDVLPRFYTVSSIAVFEDKRALLDAMTKSAPRDFRQTVFAAKADLPETVALDQKFFDRTITVNHYGKDEIRLTLGGEGAALLVALNSFSPYWRVEIDGVEGKIFPAYHTFWGFTVPTGAKSVVFRYRPPYRF